jgi:transcriptional regulator with XRE-family HTH domain
VRPRGSLLASVSTGQPKTPEVLVAIEGLAYPIDSVENDLTLGNAIKVIRTTKGIKQKDLALSLGVSANYISLVESGKRDPSLSYLRRLAEQLHVPIGLFFYCQEDISRSPAKNQIDELRDLLVRMQALYAKATPLGVGN